MVSLADRFDTLAGFFRIGAKPTGSKDPFALRRAAQGAVQILLNRDKRGINIGIEKLIDIAISVGAPEAAAATLKSELLQFFAERVRTLLEASQYDFAFDSAKRIENITAGHTSTAVDSAKLENDAERRLNELATMVGAQIDGMIAEREYRRALESFAALAPELETFFKEVMVMVDDEGVRRNRMSLLRKIGNAVMKIADVTKIVVDRSEYRA
jgi:glycyl-tRNA synthetase beta chain